MASNTGETRSENAANAQQNPNAFNVFGKAITGGTRSDNATAAGNNPNADGKRTHAINYVNNQYASFGGSGVSTRCIFYNATGATLRKTTNTLEHSYHGKLYDAYPEEVENGQWGAFLHVGNGDPSKAYVVYRVRGNNTEDFCRGLIGWETPLNALHDHHALCELRDDGYDFKNGEISERIGKAFKATQSASRMGISMTANLHNPPLLEVKFILKSND